MFPVPGALLLSRAITVERTAAELGCQALFIISPTSFVYSNVYAELAKCLRLILLERSLNPGHFQWGLMLNGELCSDLLGS